MRKKTTEKKEKLKRDERRVKNKNLKEQRTRQGTRGLKLVKGEKKKSERIQEGEGRDVRARQSRYIRLEKRGEKRADCREKRGGT